MGRRDPSFWEQVLFWPHRPPDPVKLAAAALLRHGTLPADPHRARSALPAARRSQAALALTVVASAALACWQAVVALEATSADAIVVAALIGAPAAWASLRLGRAWRRKERRVSRLAALAAMPSRRGPVVVARAR